MSENLEVMETTENMDVDVVDDMNYEEYEGGSGKVIGLVVVVVAGAAALSVAAYKKLKAKTTDRPKKKRKKLMWVEVDDSDVVDVESEEVDEEASEK